MHRAGKHVKVHQVRGDVQEARLERGRKAFWEAALDYDEQCRP